MIYTYQECHPHTVGLWSKVYWEMVVQSCSCPVCPHTIAQHSSSWLLNIKIINWYILYNACQVYKVLKTVWVILMVFYLKFYGILHHIKKLLASLTPWILHFHCLLVQPPTNRNMSKPSALNHTCKFRSNMNLVSVSACWTEMANLVHIYYTERKTSVW